MHAGSRDSLRGHWFAVVHECDFEVALYRAENAGDTVGSDDPERHGRKVSQRVNAHACIEVVW